MSGRRSRGFLPDALSRRTLLHRRAGSRLLLRPITAGGLRCALLHRTLCRTRTRSRTVLLARRVSAGRITARTGIRPVSAGCRILLSVVPRTISIPIWASIAAGGIAARTIATCLSAVILLRIIGAAVAFRPIALAGIGILGITSLRRTIAIGSILPVSAAGIGILPGLLCSLLPDLSGIHLLGVILIG